MSWGDVISIGLGLGNMALNAGNAGKLQQMQMEKVSEALFREFISMLRNGIFNLKQTAEGVLAGEETSPLQAAGAMRILDYQLSASGITPEMFPELADMEYAAATTKLISSNSGRMYATLDANGKERVDQLLGHMHQLADLRYYLDHADNASRLRAEQTAPDVNGIRQNKGCLISLGLFALGIVLAMISVELGVLIGFAAWIAGIVGLVQLARNRRAANEAQKTLKELESTIDLPRFHTLEQQFKTPDEAQQRQKESEQYVESFFGDYTLLQDGWRS
ncbi:MAG: hypothetical protein KA586_01095 [Candidatus Promineofilum sp.]|nr:hypothetical protein [Promineifilum sp.]